MVSEHFPGSNGGVDEITRREVAAMIMEWEKRQNAKMEARMQELLKKMRNLFGDFSKEFEMAQVPVETVTEANNLFLHEEENGKLDKESEFKKPINFDSLEEPAKGKEDEVADSKFPKDAVDEWPAPNQIHTFYFTNEELKAKRLERLELLEPMKVLRNENKQYRIIFDEKKKEIEQLRNTNNPGRGGLCSSGEELDDLIYSLQYHIQHESISLMEEQQILREIKQLEGTREKIIVNAAMRAKIQDSLGQKEAIQDQVKLMGVILDGDRISIFNFLFELGSNKHAYYLRRLYSFAPENTLQRWQTEPFIVVFDRGKSISPSLPTARRPEH